MANSTISRCVDTSADTRPRRPDKGLFLHPNGTYCGKVNGTNFHFGRDPDDAAARFLHDRPYLKRGEAPPPMDGQSEGYVSVDELVNRFLEKKDRDLRAGDIGARMFACRAGAAKLVTPAAFSARCCSSVRPTASLQNSSGLALTQTFITPGTGI